LGLSEANGVMTVHGSESLSLKHFDNDDDFAKWVASHKPIAVVPDDPANSKPIEQFYADKETLENDGAFMRTSWIYPSLSGVPSVSPPCWQIRNDALQLSNRNVQRLQTGIQWRIEYAGQFDRADVIDEDKRKTDAFRLRCFQPYGILTLVSTRPEGNRKLTVTQKVDDASLFFIIKSANCYVFVPCCRQLTYVIDEGGKLSEGTKVLLEGNDVPPAHARWAVDPEDIDIRGRLTVQDLSDIVSHQISLAVPSVQYPQKRLRFLPALLDGHRFDPKLICWEFEKSPGPMRLGEREVEFMIVDAEVNSDRNIFLLYCPEIRKWVTIQNGELCIGDQMALFFITQSMGYLIIHSDAQRAYSIYAEDAKNGKKLKVGNVTGDKYPRSLARWRVIPTRIVDK
jgi:hypothetical protein